MKISCHMPTTNERRRFIPLAIRCFLSQTHEDRELLVLDDSIGETVADLIPDDRRIKYVHLEQGGLPLGTKREMCCGMSQGDVFAQWDDDDWSAPSRLATQLAAFDEKTECVTLNPYPFYDEVTNIAALWGPVHVVTDGPALYSRSFWQRGGFPPLKKSAAIGFIMSKPRRLTKLIDGRGIFAALRHGQNTSAWTMSGPDWTKLDPAPFRAIFGASS